MFQHPKFLKLSVYIHNKREIEKKMKQVMKVETMKAIRSCERKRKEKKWK